MNDPSTDIVNFKVPEVRISTEDPQKRSLADVTHVVVRVSENRQKAIVESVGAQFDPQQSSPYWDFFGRLGGKGLFAHEEQLQILNTTRVRALEFIAFTSTTYVEKKLADPDVPIVVIEVTILKPRPHEPLDVFWKPANAFISGRIRDWVQNLPHLDLSAPTVVSKAD